MFTVDEFLANRYPAIHNNPLLGRPLKSVLRRLLHEKEFIGFAGRYPHLQGMDFVEQALEHFHFSYTVSDRDRENIPETGRVVIIANHPIGSLDGLALLKLIHEVRSDVRIVANDMLMHMQPLRPCLLPVNNMGGGASRKSLKEILSALNNEEAVIFFPAGEVSRLKAGGIRDGKWHKGFLRIAGQVKAPILPIHVKGKNSTGFYTASLVCKPLSTALLVDEMFRQYRRQVRITVGGLIPYRAYRELPLHNREKVKLFKKHVYRIGKGKEGIFHSRRSTAMPERRGDLKRELNKTEFLGSTPDGMKILLYTEQGSSPIKREIGRLREITFRAVEEGTGNRRDMDRFDEYYNHLILWDEKELEIVGAYRFVDSAAVMHTTGIEGLYTDSLFTFDHTHHWFLEQGLELGRSFVQQRYWGKRSLDYLWYGIGAYLVRNPGYRYLFGPVSISNSMPQAAKELLIAFYKLYFGGAQDLACSKNPFRFSLSSSCPAGEFHGDDYKKEFKKLKSLLSNMGTSIPTLYKQYSELCEPGGVSFLDFNVDPYFGNCVDGLVVVDLEKLKAKKRQRYLENTILQP